MGKSWAHNNAKLILLCVSCVLHVCTWCDRGLRKRRSAPPFKLYGSGKTSCFYALRSQSVCSAIFAEYRTSPEARATIRSSQSRNGGDQRYAREMSASCAFRNTVSDAPLRTLLFVTVALCVWQRYLSTNRNS